MLHPCSLQVKLGARSGLKLVLHKHNPMLHVYKYAMHVRVVEQLHSASLEHAFCSVGCLHSVVQLWSVDKQ
jgi:hypothetical protein